MEARQRQPITSKTTSDTHYITRKEQEPLSKDPSKIGDPPAESESEFAGFVKVGREEERIRSELCDGNDVTLSRMHSDRNAINELVQSFKSIQDPESLFLVEIATSAVFDEKPKYTLQEICAALEECGSWSIVDPLHFLPLLIGIPKDGATELIQSIARNANAKECMIAIQEAIEYLDHVTEKSSDEIGLAERLIRLIGAASECVPRLQLRKKGPAETIQPIFEHLQSVIDTVSLQANRREGREILERCNQLVRVTLTWASESLNPDSLRVSAILSGFILSTLGALSPYINSSLAERRFAIYYPKLVFNPIISEDALKGAEIMQGFVNTTEKLGLSPKLLNHRPHSLGKLILLAHQDPTVIPTSNGDIDELIPLLTSSIRQNAAIEESLALLLTFMCSSKDILPQEIVDPLATLLTPLAASHSDPTVRHISFRILSSILARSPPPLQLAHLTSLLSDCPFTQMRVAAIGLVKEAFLSASTLSPSSSLFNSPSLIRAVGPILFRSDPPDILDNPSPKTLEKIIESSESVRLTECLSFYYVWLMRDIKNSTGIRDRDRIKTVENGLLGPLRHALAVWSVDLSISQEPHVLMAIASLQTSIERIDSTISNIMT